MSILRNPFNRSRGSTAKIHVPKLSYHETLKRYINILDRVSDKTNDFQQLLAVFLTTMDKKTYKKFSKISFGSPHDAYSLEIFMETVLNLLSLQTEGAIKKEFRYREEILEMEYLYQELTILSLTENQQSELLAFEQIHKDDFLSRMTTAREKDIVAGNVSSKNILESEHAKHANNLQQESDIKELSQTKNSNFKVVTSNQQKTHFQRKSHEFPKLEPVYFDDLQNGLNSIKELENGVGTVSSNKVFPD